MVAADEELIRQRKRKIARALNASCAWQDSIQFCGTNFAPSLRLSRYLLNIIGDRDRGENNFIGTGGDSRCVGISAVGFGLDGSPNNTGLDQFGRITSQLWTDSTGVVVDGYTYTYDANSNVTSKTNVLDSAYSETYTNDNLNRLTAVTRGGAAYQSWNLDSQGNWSSSTTSGTTQTRTTNSQNQITSITGTTGISDTGTGAAKARSWFRKIGWNLARRMMR